MRHPRGGLARSSTSGPDGDLTEAERAELRERFFQLSVKQRGKLYPARAAKP